MSMIRERRSSWTTSTRSTQAWKPCMNSWLSLVIFKEVKPIFQLWTSMIHLEHFITRSPPNKTRVSKSINWLACISNHQENSLTLISIVDLVEKRPWPHSLLSLPWHRRDIPNHLQWSCLMKLTPILTLIVLLNWHLSLIPGRWRTNPK